ncbi:hypothetical protein JCM19232_2839 [Vibrio ishigakensis]|uniref:Methyltransferase type 11 domain-containing protein n=1 Tax=Vibrio ishigakensis TaxID=1481914 RepID=A0A0B8PRJ1_9VIBR|nr:hypothetical protein JCM19232_2839 [Vibrio ishigakensis]
MSSPIAKPKKNIIDKTLIKIHNKSSHLSRVEILSNLFYEEIVKLGLKNKRTNFLDVGCGDMSIAKSLSSKLNNCNYTCIDIYPNTNKWDNYVQFNGKNIPFENDSFDIVIFSDMLHHDYENIINLLEEAKRVSSFIFIKDHFEYSYYSRKILQAADFIGNYGYGVSIPKRYLSKSSFSDFLNSVDLVEVKRICPIHLYAKSKIIKYIFNPKYQFMSISKKHKITTL